MAEITVANDLINDAYNCLNTRRGIVITEELVAGTPLRIIKAHLPVAESFGFTAHLRAMTEGTTFT